ncbi:hypothetical protein FHX75_11138 [Micromonospora palomenae]|uniref:Fibronectin type-III domain-containing protein n=1 Tax=Micromonospora palomenae TaxID=1461247 RepID=A0A561WT43_9ACTN|nr:hypothetical protein FHX75_11138 [Micromonospora palomenae]
MSTPPVSAPPWGLTAPPWSSVAPPQPLTTAPVRDEPAEDDDATAQADIDGPLELVDEPLVAYDMPPRVAKETDAPIEQPRQETAYPPVYQPPPAYPVEAPPERRGRGRVVLAVVAGVVVLGAAGVVGAVALDRGEPGVPPAPTGGTPGAAKATGAPPTGLKLRDDGTSVTITWSDPAGGGVPFMVAGGRAGKALGVMATIDPGQTTYTVNGLSSTVDYCFTVLAVYSTDAFATSGQVCTDRERRTPAG